MWFECDAEEVRENGRRSFEEKKRNSKAPGRHVVVCLHIDRERRLGAKSARDTQRRGDWSGDNPARRRVSADRIDEASVIEALSARLPQRMAPRGFVETPLSLRRSQNKSRGARNKHQPQPNLSAQASCAPRSPAFESRNLNRTCSGSAACSHKRCRCVLFWRDAHARRDYIVDQRSLTHG